MSREINDQFLEDLRTASESHVHGAIDLVQEVLTGVAERGGFDKLPPENQVTLVRSIIPMTSIAEQNVRYGNGKIDDRMGLIGEIEDVIPGDETESNPRVDEILAENSEIMTETAFASVESALVQTTWMGPKGLEKLQQLKEAMLIDPALAEATDDESAKTRFEFDQARVSVKEERQEKFWTSVIGKRVSGEDGWSFRGMMKGVKETVKENGGIWQTLKKIGSGLGQAIKEGLKEVKQWGSKVIETVKTGVKEAWENRPNGKDLISKVWWKEQKNGLVRMGKAVKEIGKAVVEKIKHPTRNHVSYRNLEEKYDKVSAVKVGEKYSPKENLKLHNDDLSVATEIHSMMFAIAVEAGDPYLVQLAGARLLELMNYNENTNGGFGKMWSRVKNFTVANKKVWTRVQDDRRDKMIGLRMARKDKKYWDEKLGLNE